ncbi:hypothetical protein J6590_104056 [Homalodisca vitripennis]|nr:hypothetical protein J6590_104056 [Homalodisca vitripennis]
MGPLYQQTNEEADLSSAHLSAECKAEVVVPAAPRGGQCTPRPCKDAACCGVVSASRAASRQRFSLTFYSVAQLKFFYNRSKRKSTTTDVLTYARNHTTTCDPLPPKMGIFIKLRSKTFLTYTPNPRFTPNSAITLREDRP